MTWRRRTGWGAALLLALAIPPAHARPDLVVLVRHAEKATEPGPDPALSTAGADRAQALAEVLAELPLRDALVSTYRRTADTAAPTAKAHDLSPRPVAAGSRHAVAVAEAVMAVSGGAVLVVGHGNTLPAVLEALGGPRLPELGHCEFDALWILDLSDKNPGLIRARYGAPNPAC